MHRHTSGGGTAEKGAAEGEVAPRQGLTLVHFSAQRERFLWDGGRI